MTRVGAQRPRLQLIPAGIVTSAAEEAIGLAASCGMTLDDWQRWCLHHMLGEREDGSWAASQSLLIVPRQAGKSALFEVVELAALYLWGERKIIHSAHLAKTAAEHMQRMVNLIRSNPDLEAITHFYFANGKERIQRTDTGACIEFITRGKRAVRGGSPQRVVFDEALFLTDEQMQAILPGLSAQSMNAEGAPQFMFGSSAPLAESLVLHRLRDQAMAGNLPRTFYAEWSCEDGADPYDRENWYASNPGLGIRISEEWIEQNELSILSPEAFAVERLGVPVRPKDESGSAVIPMPAWLACVVDDSAPVVPEVFAVDVTPDRSTAAVAFAARVGDRVHVGVADHRPGQGTEWVRVLVADATQRGVPVVTDDPTLAAELPDVRRTTTRELVEACGSLFDAVQSRRLRVRRQRSLEDAVAAGRSRPLSHGWAWDRRGVDVSPLVAATLAFHSVANQAEPAPLVFAY